ncbi:MAG TPA: BON domain-containing protein [Thermoanaerobaculia bacterium]|nr:BON domain-containing protein [Thermoanaerobaculia bacterium]
MRTAALRAIRVTDGSSMSTAGERPSFRGRGPTNYRRSDERLRQLISERLEDHEAIDATDMEVEVRDGVVTLTGTVDSRRTKRLAEDVALITTGVLDVQNALKIDPGFFGRMAERVREAVEGE